MLYITLPPQPNTPTPPSPRLNYANVLGTVYLNTPNDDLACFLTILDVPDNFQQLFGIAEMMNL